MGSLIGLALLCVLAPWLALIVWHDIRSFRIPDALSLPLVLAGLLANATVGSGAGPALWGAAAGYAGFVSVEYGYRFLRGRAGLGRGDAKLAAAGGAWCGVAALPIIVTIAALSALLFVGLRRVAVGKDPTRTEYLPFAPFLAAAILAAFAQRLAAGGAG